MSTRLDVKKTYKLYIGGKFPRSESGRYLPAKSMKGAHLDNFAHASRKQRFSRSRRGCTGGERRVVARPRPTIVDKFYISAAEMLQNRAAELVAEIARSTDVTAAKAKREVTAAVDRLVHFAGWTDKYQQVFGSVNPVASSHFQFLHAGTDRCRGRPCAGRAQRLLALVSLIAPVILSGNTAIVVASEKFSASGRDL